ncbi:hypothetical protein BGP_6265 [Beggiatoa sp. PS]|nr:hypothetical protein BGP_6265 [Beggiatoa sp. PS]
MIGIQVSNEQLDEFQTFLDNLGYPYWAEMDNPAYHLFLN